MSNIKVYNSVEFRKDLSTIVPPEYLSDFNKIYFKGCEDYLATNLVSKVIEQCKKEDPVFTEAYRRASEDLKVNTIYGICGSLLFPLVDFTGHENKDIYFLISHDQKSYSIFDSLDVENKQEDEIDVLVKKTFNKIKELNNTVQTIFLVDFKEKLVISYAHESVPF